MLEQCYLKYLEKVFRPLLLVPLIDWGLRDYGNPDQLGLEPTPEEYVENMVQVFREVKRVLRDDGTVWLNLGSSYINKNINSQEMVLRDDISVEELEYVMKELLLYGKQQKTLPSVR